MTGKPDKACKIIATGIVSTWFSWHVGVTQVSSVYAEDYIADPFFIDRGDDFYYTFWAKSDTDGTKMYIGATQLYDPKNNGGDSDAWSKVPYVELYYRMETIWYLCRACQTRSYFIRYSGQKQWSSLYRRFGSRLW
ncbi:hypothetical protein NXX53_01840 [Bacteroides salyersiae]|nr:hypothetical protein [Bacteroides salyersiae]